MEEPGPGIASANRARKGAFSSLIGQAVADASALDALVFAYEALPVAERLRMLQAIVQDAESPGPALAALLSVEPDPALRTRLGELLRTHASIHVAFVAGSADEGEALLPDVDRDGVRESLRIRWTRCEISYLEIETDDVSSLDGRATSRHSAMELIAPMLWRHLRRGGGLPSGLTRFARYL